MNASQESIRQLTRSYAGVRSFLWILLPFAIAPNVRAALAALGYVHPDSGGILMAAGVVGAILLTMFYRRRFGEVAPQRPESWSEHPWHGLGGVLALGAFTVGLLTVWSVSGITLSEFGLLASSIAAILIMATNRAARGTSWIVPLAACLWLTLVLTIPTLQPYRAFGHVAMAAALIAGAIQYHLFLVRGFEHARV